MRAVSFFLFIWTCVTVYAQQFSTQNQFLIRENGLVGDPLVCYVDDGPDYSYEMQLSNPSFQTLFELTRDSYSSNCFLLKTKQEWNCCINPGTAFEISLQRTFHGQNPTPCGGMTCTPGFLLNEHTCMCEQDNSICYEQACTWGYTWDWGSCSCVSTCGVGPHFCSYEYTWNTQTCMCEFTGIQNTPGPQFTPDYTPQYTPEPNFTPEPQFTPDYTPQYTPEPNFTSEPQFTPDYTPQYTPQAGCQPYTCFGQNEYWDVNTCSCVFQDPGSGSGSGFGDSGFEMQARRRLQTSRITQIFNAIVECTGKFVYTCKCCGSDSTCSSPAPSAHPSSRLLLLQDQDTEREEVPISQTFLRSLVSNYESFLLEKKQAFMGDKRRLALADCACPSDINYSALNQGTAIVYSNQQHQYVQVETKKVPCPTPTASPSPVSVSPPTGDCNFAYLGYFVIAFQPKTQGHFRMAVKLVSNLQGEQLIHVFQVTPNNFRDGKMYQFLHLYQLGSEIHFILNTAVYSAASVVYKARISDFIDIQFIGDGLGQHTFDFFKHSYQNFPYLIDPEVFDMSIQAGDVYEILFNDLFYVINCVSPSSSPSPSRTPSSSITPTRTPSITPSTTPSVTQSTTPSASITPSPSPSISITPSRSPTPSVSATMSRTPTPSPSPSCVWSALSCDPSGQYCTLKNTQNPCVTPTPITQPSQIPGIKTIRIRAPRTMRVFV